MVMVLFIVSDEEFKEKIPVAFILRTWTGQDVARCPSPSLSEL